jgi:hypothetical protein
MSEPRPETQQAPHYERHENSDRLAARLAIAGAVLVGPGCASVIIQWHLVSTKNATIPHFVIQVSTWALAWGSMLLLYALVLWTARWWWRR